MINIELHKKLNAVNGEMQLGINVSIKPGQFVTLYGNSGSGKTSILRMIAGLLKPDSGKISIAKIEWLNSNNGIYVKPQHRKIGFVFQDYTLFPNMTVEQNLLYALEKKQDKKIIQELIDIIELKEFKDKKPTLLSGGQKQRVALARALVRKPKILLLDEPLSALDQSMRVKLQDYILKVHKQYNLTTILVSHDISEVVKMSDKIFILEDGKITKQGNPVDIFTNKQVSGKFQFIGEIIRLEKEDVLYIATILIGVNFVKIIVEENEIKTIKIGDKVMVASKAFNPVIKKLL